MIPKVIHYCWFGGKPLPRLARQCISTWRKYCPDYEIKQWDEGNFDVLQSPFISSAYKAGAWAFVSDWARLKIVFDEGGIYLDTDVRLLKNMDFLLTNDCYFGIEQNSGYCATGLGFGAIKGHSAVRAMLDVYDQLEYRSEVAKDIACPILNDRVIRELGFKGDGFGPIEHLSNVTVYPCKYFDPVAPGDAKDLMCDDTVSVHLYANSWGTSGERFKRSIINMLGAEKADWLKRVISQRWTLNP